MTLIILKGPNSSHIMSYYAYMSPKNPHRGKAKNRGCLVHGFEPCLRCSFFSVLHEDNSLLIKKLMPARIALQSRNPNVASFSNFEIQQICIQDLCCALLYAKQIKKHKISLKIQLVHQGNHNILSKKGLLILIPD